MILFIVLALVNFVPLFILKTTTRFWIICIPLGILMIAGFVVWRTNRSKKTEALEAQYINSTGSKSYGDFKLWTALEDLKKSTVITNRKILNEIFFQIFLMWILQMIALRRTRINYFFWLSWLTGVLFLAAFILEALIGIVPTGPLV